MTTAVLSRRTFFGRTAMGAGAVMLAATNTGCWFTGTVFTQIMAYVGVGLTAFDAVVKLLAPGSAPVIDEIIVAVKAGFADLQLAVQAYNNAPAADKATLLGRISTALAVLQAQLQNFWGNLNLPGGTLLTLIQGLLSIILSTLAGFASQLPAPATAMRALPANAIQVTPQKRTKKQFEEDFNKLLTDAGKPAVKFS